MTLDNKTDMELSVSRQTHYSTTSSGREKRLMAPKKRRRIIVCAECAASTGFPHSRRFFLYFMTVFVNDRVTNAEIPERVGKKRRVLKMVMKNAILWTFGEGRWTAETVN